jgi:hypothetical protein
MSVRRPHWRWSLALAFGAIFLTAPVFDELIGAREFTKLCEANDHVTITTRPSSGTVYLADIPDVQVTSMWIPVRATRWRYVDVQTGATIVSYDTLTAGGGWLSRTLPVGAGHGTLLFNGFCRPRATHSTALLSNLHLTQVQRSQVGKE